MRTSISVVTLLVLAAAPLAAQPGQARPTPQQRDQRYQITTMERVLEGAVEHGAKVTRDRLQASSWPEMLLSDNARVRGYRLDGYGLFFDVAVPMLEGSMTWGLKHARSEQPRPGKRAERPALARRKERRHQLRAGAETRRVAGRAGFAERSGSADRRRPDADRFGCSSLPIQHPAPRQPPARCSTIRSRRSAPRSVMR